MKRFRLPHATRIRATIIALASGVACESGTSPEPRTPGIHFVAGAPHTDTITAISELEIAVLNSSGRPAATREVRFTALPRADIAELRYPVLVGQMTSQFVSAFLSDTTDSGGRLRVRVQLGGVVGSAELRIEVPELAYVDTARFTVLVGAPFRVRVTPHDSALFVGNSYTLHGTVRDRADNPRTDPVSYTVLAGPVSVGASSGLVTASAIGRGIVLAHSPLVVGLADSASISVVPNGMIVTHQMELGNSGQIGMFVMQMDGSQRQPIATGFEDVGVPEAFAWSPDGTEVAMRRGFSIRLQAPGGAERVLVTVPAPLMAGIRFSRDGQWVYFAENTYYMQSEPGHLPGGMFRVRRDGTGLQKFGEDDGYVAGGWTYHRMPSPSPDGSAVAYLHGAGIDDCVKVIDPVTSQLRTFNGTDCFARAEQVAWSPVADLIAYMRDRQLWLMQSYGTGKRLVADHLCCDASWIDWSPDGKWVLVSFRLTSLASLINVETGMRLPLSPLVGYGMTAWRP